MKTIRLTKLVTVLIFFMLFACENQEILQLEEETQTTESNFNLESFQIKELPDLASEINILTKSSKIGFASKSTGDHIVLDESRILAVTDSIGNTTFSMRMYVPDTPYNVFHNLVLKQTPDGEMNEPFVLRYEVGEDYWTTYISSERKEAPFNGNIEVYSLSSINELSSKTNKDGTDDQPCYTYSSTTGSSGSGSGSSGSSGGNSNSSDNADSGTQGGFSPTGIVWSRAGGGYVEVGTGYFGRPAPDGGDTKKAYSAKNGECPEDEMLIPINEEEETPPSCKSFDFKKVTPSGDWQAAAVKDFEMGVGVSIKNNFQIYRIKFPLLTFETWSKDRFNNVLTAGAAAELAAEATHETAKVTVNHFKDKYDFTEYDVKKWFEDELKKRFRSKTDGGTVRRGNPYNLNAKKFETGRTNGCD